jgi:hypothetical protein
VIGAFCTTDRPLNPHRGVEGTTGAVRAADLQDERRAYLAGLTRHVGMQRPVTPEEADIADLQVHDARAGVAVQSA